MSPTDSIVQNGIEQIRLGQLQQAEALFRKAMAIDPAHMQALRQMGLLALRVQRFDVAADLFQRALRSDPASATLHNELGGALFAQGKLPQSIQPFTRAIELDPKMVDAYSNLALVYEKLGQFEPAIEVLRLATRLAPDVAHLHAQLATLLRSAHRFDESLEACRELVRCDPDSALAQNNLSAALKENNLFEEAIVAAERAIALAPTDHMAHANLGSALLDLGRLDESVAAHEKALKFAPDHPAILFNLSLVYVQKGMIARAVELARRVIELSPSSIAYQSALLQLLHFQEDIDGPTLLAEHREWNRRLSASLPARPIGHLNDPDPNRRLRIGYVSSDLRHHPVGLFAKTLLMHHDHQKVEVFCYAEVPRPDDVTRALQQHADVWRPIQGLGMSQAAELIQRDRIDILVDLNLHTGGNWLPAFALKPAPVQVTYLAYPGTSGLATMDYRLTDPYLDPVDSDTTRFYSEASYRLPNTYWCYEPREAAPTVNRLPALDAGYITFASLNSFHKVSQDCLKTWATILARLPGSKLILHAGQGDHRQRVLEIFSAQGVERPDERVEFVGFQPMREYFESYHRADIALDPFPYNGGTTTCDALWMGLPVVTLAGQIAVQRSGLSILSNVGFSEWVATDPAKYLEIATSLAADPNALEQHRQSLRQRMLASPLMDAKQFAQDVERAFREMWMRWCAARQ